MNFYEIGDPTGPVGILTINKPFFFDCSLAGVCIVSSG